MRYILIALAVSFLVTLAAIRAQFAGSRRDFPGVRGLTRAGGVGVAGGLLASFLLRLFDDAPHAAASAQLGLTLLATSIPIFLAGLIEDFTHRVSAGSRLLAALASAACAGWLLGAWVPRVDVALLDAFLAVPVVSIVLTCLLVAGITHAFNIIDGFNGLASGVAALILLGIAYVAFKVGDVPIVAAALTAVGAIAGFMLLNFPRGLVFLGDGGAYLSGFWIGLLLVLIVVRNPAVSAWFPVLVCSYPVCELLFTIYRRGFVRRTHPGLPDFAHLHHLIYMRLVRWLVGASIPEHRIQRNSLTAPYLWLVASVGLVPSLIFWRSTTALQIGTMAFVAAYIYAYVRIAKFRAPRWWVLRKSRKDGGDRSDPS